MILTYKTPKPDKEIIDYIDFDRICKDYDLQSGDISPHQQLELENILKSFINQNKTMFKEF